MRTSAVVQLRCNCAWLLGAIVGSVEARRNRARTLPAVRDYFDSRFLRASSLVSSLVSSLMRTPTSSGTVLESGVGHKVATAVFPTLKKIENKTKLLDHRTALCFSIVLSHKVYKQCQRHNTYARLTAVLLTMYFPCITDLHFEDRAKTQNSLLLPFPT